MPSGEHNIVVFLDQPLVDQHQTQTKVCSACDSAVTALFIHEADSTLVCGGCRDKLLSAARDGLFPTENHSLRLGSETVSRLSQDADAVNLHPTRLVADDHSVDQDADIGSAPSSPTPSVFEPSYRHSLVLSGEPSHDINKNLLCDTSNTNVSQYQNHASPPLSAAVGCSYTIPDPLVDITHLRVRSQGRHCLYPGASFQGTQRSGKNSYDVNVTIVDVDFSSSFLCGYLRIRGLTDDWPELTTYFDAEIIGSRYGFLTQNWGATEQEDMIHWSRFPAFRHARSELKMPHLTMSDRDRGAVFMRWKERFLVPDHRVQDISGASFAGFYYVCVDFNPPPVLPTRSGAPQVPLTPESDMNTPLSKADSPQRSREEPGVPRQSAPRATRSGVPFATMNGFYFHQTSEPYQHLSLCHVPERTSSTFEFR